MLWGTVIVLEKHDISVVYYAFTITWSFGGGGSSALRHDRDFACQPCLLVKCLTWGTNILHGAPDLKEWQ